SPLRPSASPSRAAVFPSRSCHLLHLHPFPTRRSSDLDGVTEGHRAAADVHLLRLDAGELGAGHRHAGERLVDLPEIDVAGLQGEDRKSTRLNSSHVKISYAVFCLKKKTEPPSPTF